MTLRLMAGAIFTLFLSQFWTSGAFAAEDELFVPDVLKAGYVFPSGYQYQDCESDLVSAADRAVSLLSESLPVFKRLGTPEKVKAMHTVVSLIHDLSYKDIRQGLPGRPTIFSNPKVESGLMQRLHFFANSSRKKLAFHTREVLVIAHRLLPLVAYVHKFSPDVQKGLLEYFDFALNLESEFPLQKVDYDLRALAFGSLAILKTARLIERNNPEQAVLEGMQALLESTQENLKGHRHGYALESGLMLQQHVLSGINAFKPYDLERIEQGMIESINAIENLSSTISSNASTESARVWAMLGQIDGLLKQPAIARVPRYKAAVEKLRSQFVRPQDPNKIN